MTVRSSFGRGRVRVNENDFFIAGTNGTPAQGPLRPLIFCHGALSSAEIALSRPGELAMIRALADYFTVGVADLGTFDTWGVGTGITAVSQLKAYMETTYGTSGPVTFVGSSMGTITSMAYARNFPSNVRAISAQIPCLNLDDMYYNRGFSSLINTAYMNDYGVTYPSATRSAFDPIVYGSDAVGSIPNSIPVKLHQSDNDTTCPRAAHGDLFQANRPATLLATVSTSGHDDTTETLAIPSTVQFCRFLA